MSKIDEIREKIEVCFDPEEKEITLSICRAVEFLLSILKLLGSPKVYNKTVKSVNDILEGK